MTPKYIIWWVGTRQAPQVIQKRLWTTAHRHAYQEKKCHTDSLVYFLWRCCNFQLCTSSLHVVSYNSFDYKQIIHQSTYLCYYGWSVSSGRYHRVQQGRWQLLPDAAIREQLNKIKWVQRHNRMALLMFLQPVSVGKWTMLLSCSSETMTKNDPKRCFIHNFHIICRWKAMHPSVYATSTFAVLGEVCILFGVSLSELQIHEK